MGCDIHVYVEYKDKSPDAFLAGWRNWGGKFYVGRDYHLFARLNGVRSYDGDTKVVTTSALPQDLDWVIESEYYCYVVEDADIDKQRDREYHYVAKSSADRWVANGSSKVHPTNPNLITNPDWHSAGCINLEQWKKLLRKQEAGARWHVITAMCNELEKRGYETRIVFWFDN